MKRIVTFIAAVVFVCVALGVTLAVTNDSDNADEQRRSRCAEYNPFDEDC